MATSLDDARIRVILEILPEKGVPRGTSAPATGGGEADGRGGDGAEGPPIPGVPTPQEREERRGERRPLPGLENDEFEWKSTTGGPRGGRSGVERAGDAVTNIIAARALRGAPRGSGALGRALLNVNATQFGLMVAGEEAIRLLGPMVSAMAEEVVKAQLEPVKAVITKIPGMEDVNLGIGDIGQKVGGLLDKGIQGIPSLFQAGSRALQLERAKLLLGGPYSEAAAIGTFLDELEIAYAQNLAQSTFRRFGGRMVGEAIGSELGKRVRHNMSR